MFARGRFQVKFLKRPKVFSKFLISATARGEFSVYGFDARGKCSVMVQFVKAIFENIDFNCYQRRISGIV